MRWLQEASIKGAESVGMNRFTLVLEKSTRADSKGIKVEQATWGGGESSSLEMNVGELFVPDTPFI